VLDLGQIFQGAPQEKRSNRGNSSLVESNIHDVSHEEIEQNKAQEDEQSNEGLDAIKLNDLNDEDQAPSDIRLDIAQPNGKNSSFHLEPCRKEKNEEESWVNVLEAENSLERNGTFQENIPTIRSESSIEERFNSVSEIKTESKGPKEIHNMDFGQFRSEEKSI
jgi:hypothetical protein